MKKCSIECSVEQKLNERSECSMFSAPIRALNVEQSSSLNNPRAKGNQLALSRLRDLALSAVLFLLVFPLVAAYLLAAFVAGALSTLARAWRVRWTSLLGVLNDFRKQ